MGDPTEAALLVAARKGGLSEAMLGQFPRVAELPFDSVRKRMTTVHRMPQEGVACMKGAVNEVLPRCVVGVGESESEWDSRRGIIETVASQLADRGLRVLAVALRRFPAEMSDSMDRLESDLTFLGLIGMEDPPRAEVRSAIAHCREAGIRIIMATGDDGHTASAIAREIGLLKNKVHVVSGAQLDRVSDQALGLLLGDRNILFSRVSPAHKLRLVETLQSRGEVVAVTGDGVNDAPALKRADVGVAMGVRGTDVARAAADVILLDDNFATIVAAVEEGRAVYENVRKFVTYIFASNVPEVVPFLAFVLFRIPLPLTVMQILAVDLGTDLLPALALGMESPEPGLMRRPPRARSAPLLDLRTLLRAYGWLGALEAALGMGGFFFVYMYAGWRWGEPLADGGTLYVTATTMSLAGIVACQLGNALACRSERKSVFTLGLYSNRALIGAMFAEVAVLVCLIYYAPLAEVFHLAPLATEHWVLLATFGPSLLLAEELRKGIWTRGRRR
ncbi:MAG: cation-transporting P-type ATPase [Planctomycetota bacterium]